MKNLHLIITGGTIDSIFDPTKDMVVVNDSTTIARYISEVVNPQFRIIQEIVTMRDSREITLEVRKEILRSIEKSPHEHILITHGTYTMAVTAEYLAAQMPNPTKRVVLTGSMLPLQGFSPSDAPFNLGFAIGALINSPPGVFLAMNGSVFPAGQVTKNLEVGRFEKA